MRTRTKVSDTSDWMEPDETAVMAPVGAAAGPESSECFRDADAEYDLLNGNPRTTIATGAIVGSYRLIERLGMGGMGVVYLAEHVDLGHRVALKFLHEWHLTDASIVPRFIAEAMAASRISHPGVVSVFDYSWFEGGMYFAMEYLAGESLQARLMRERRLSIGRILDIGVQLGLTLEATHAAGVIHRDLKPANTYLVPDPHGSGHERVKVLDFGVAKVTRDVSLPVTQRGELLGTPDYMAPEQFTDPRAVDHRSDIYSFGCLLYQLATGRLPFSGSLLATLFAHRTSEPPLPRSIDPTIPRALESLILCMMAKSPDGRPGSMAEVAQSLASMLAADGQTWDEEARPRQSVRTAARRPARSGRRGA
jgi:eukaryotic-like serine/threonine-protein kinase